jgi:hypothetical protein
MEQPNDEEKKFIRERVIQYIKKINSNINIENIKINILKYAGGLNNDNYKITIEKDSKIINAYFFKIFKNKIDNKKLESDVQYLLSKKNLSPKLLEMNSKEKYRIDEYLPNISYTDMENCLKDKVIENILSIILGFNNLYHACFYKIDNYEIIYDEKNSIINHNKDIISIDFKINSFNNHIYEYLPKAEIALKKFIESYNANKGIIDLDLKINDLKYYVDNYKNILVEDIFKHNGYFIFSHSDFHRGNIVHIGNNYDKLFVLDNEFINLNLIGYDLIYYLIKSVFNNGIVDDYLNVPNFYKIYLNYIKKFMNEYEGFISNKDNKLNEEKNNIEKIISSKEYYLRLIKLVLLFDIIYCCCLINFVDEYITKKAIFQFFNYLYLNIEILKKIEKYNEDEI